MLVGMFSKVQWGSCSNAPDVLSDGTVLMCTYRRSLMYWVLNNSTMYNTLRNTSELSHEI